MTSKPRHPTSTPALQVADASTPEADAAAPTISEAEPECVAQAVVVERVVPALWLVVDGSGSMLEPLSPSDDTSRWNALRTALLDPEEGIVKNAEHDARWGLLAYDGPLSGADPMTPSGPTLECPRLVEVEPALDNFAALDEGFTSEPLGGSTPTDKALATVVERLDGQETAGVILFTDGQPNDFCSGSATEEIRARVVEQVESLASAGHNVYVVSLAADDPALSQHLSDLARASGTGTQVFTPKSTAELRDAIEEITGVPVTCEITLNGGVKAGDTCLVQVQLNGEELPCESDDGWHLKDPKTIELTGEACEHFKSDPNAEVSAQFPCAIIE